MKAKHPTLVLMALLASFALLASSAQAGKKRHYHPGKWNYGYYQPAPYYYYRPVYRPVYYVPAPVYYPRPVIQVNIGGPRGWR